MSMIATVLFGAALSLASGTPTIAADTATAAERRVETRDLDLFSAEGRRTLDRRIASAARSVCRVESRSSLSSAWRFQSRCVEAAIARANRQRDRLMAARGITPSFRTAANQPR